MDAEAHCLQQAAVLAAASASASVSASTQSAVQSREAHRFELEHGHWGHVDMLRQHLHLSHGLIDRHDQQMQHMLSYQHSFQPDSHHLPVDPTMSTMSTMSTISNFPILTAHGAQSAEVQSAEAQSMEAQSVEPQTAEADVAPSSPAHGRIPGPPKYTSMGPPASRPAVSAPDNIVEWRHKFFNVSENALTLPKQEWDDLWIWIDNIWTPRRVPYTKKDGIVHYEWRCRYHKKEPLPSQSTGKRKRGIRKGYGCPARMTANLTPSTRIFSVEGFETHNHGLEELDATKICSGVRKWTSMHVQMGMQPKQIEALINGEDDADAAEGGGRGAREALDIAGGKLLDEKTIRNIARRWRWPAAKFSMRQDDLFRELHSLHNTFPFAIQEPEAFHRDVCDVANVADTLDDLHRLLDERKVMRLRELDDRFDSAAAILTKDPSQVDQQRWDHVLGLFRDRSYDALVRYFSAYMDAEQAADLQGQGNGSRTGPGVRPGPAPGPGPTPTELGQPAPPHH